MYLRLRPIWLTIRCSSLAFRQRHRLMWCALCSCRVPHNLCGALSAVTTPTRKVQRLVWVCLGCWYEEGGQRAAT
jgi:hypothetical protein